MMSKKRRNRNNTSSIVASEKVDIVKEDIIASDEIDVATSSEVVNEEVDEPSVVSVDISKDDEISVVEKLVDAPDETKPNFGASEEPVMAKIVANVPEGESNMVDMNTIEGLNGKGNSCLSYFETEDSELASEDSEDVLVEEVEVDDFFSSICSVSICLLLSLSLFSFLSTCN